MEDLQRETADRCYIHNKNVYVEVQTRDGKVNRAHFVKQFFSVKEMEMLHETLHSCDYWKRKEDKRGDRPETIMGVWPARGHCNPGDPTYPAGFGGKYEDKLQYPILTPVLERLGEKATLLVKEKRPDIYNLLKGENQLCSNFGLFHLFLSPLGFSLFHKDSFDYVAFIFGVHVNPNSTGGALEIGGSKRAFNIRVGDVLMLDSDALWHGSRDYQGDEDPFFPHEDDRMVGIFVLHRTFLKLRGVEWDTMLREDFGSRTIPNVKEPPKKKKKRMSPAEKKQRKKENKK